MAINKEVNINVTGNAVQSLTDIGRIAQDLPFGFVAIQNNIGPLFESFGRLSAGAGGAMGAIKALGSVLTGPAGIGLAISVITSAVTFLTQTFNPWEKMFGTAGDATKKAKEELKKFNEEMNKTIATADTTGTKLKTYISIAQDVTKSENERSIAIKEANKIMGEYGEKITLANVGTKAITDQTNQYVIALKKQAVSQIYASQLTKQYTEEQIALANFTKENIERNKKFDEINALRAKKAATPGGAGTAEINTSIERRTNELNQLDKKRDKAQQDYLKVVAKGNILESNYQKAISDLLESEPVLNEDKNKKGTKEKKKKEFDIVEFLAQDSANAEIKIEKDKFIKLEDQENERFRKQNEKLKDALNNGVITQKQFDEASKELLKNHNTILNGINDEQYNFLVEQNNKELKAEEEFEKAKKILEEQSGIQIKGISQKNAIDIYTNNKSIRDKEYNDKKSELQSIINDKTLTFEVRKKAAEDLIQLNKNYNKEIKNDNNVAITSGKLDINNILNNEKLSYQQRIDALKAYNQEVKNNTQLSEDEKNAIIKAGTDQIIKTGSLRLSAQAEFLSAVGQGLGNLEGLFKKFSDGQKAIALLTLITETASGYMRGLAIAQQSAAAAGPAAAYAFPLFYAQQISAVLGAAAKFKQIFGSGGGGGGAANTTSAPSLAPVISSNSLTSPQTQLAASIAGAQREPVKAFVVSNEMTTQQALDRNIKSNATFG